jgi:hypothetical protein
MIHDKVNMDGFDVNPPKRHVLSFRVSEGEWQRLQNVAQQAGADISSLLRQSLNLLLKSRQD